VVVVAALYILITLGSIVLRNGDVSTLEVVLLVAAALIVVGVAFFGSSGPWTG
jgi:hypothetical protein